MFKVKLADLLTEEKYFMGGEIRWRVGCDHDMLKGCCKKA
jgi:hypothetical protein